MPPFASQENEEYEEREDEFDLVAAPIEAKAEEAEEHIDITTLEPSELAHLPDANDSDEELVCLPTKPEPDEETATNAG